MRHTTTGDIGAQRSDHSHSRPELRRGPHRGWQGIPAARALLAASIIIASGSALVGCQSQVPQRWDGAPIASNGGGSELVFHSPGVAGTVIAGAEQYRRDNNVGIRSAPTRFDQDSWPAARRPTLDRNRRLNVPDRAGTVIYFREEQQVRDSLSINGGTVVIP